MHYKQANKRQHPLPKGRASNPSPTPLYIIHISYSSLPSSSTSLDNSKSASNQLRDLFILVLEQTERIRYVVPLSLGLASR